MRLTGTLRHSDLEGGVWLLETSDGREFQLDPPPRGIPDGATVEVDGQPDDEGVSFQMAAPILKVRKIHQR